MEALVNAQRAITWFLAGLIWFVQLVHYPSFAAWNHATFARHHALHVRYTGFLAGPAMTLELALSLLTLVQPPPAWGAARAERALGALLLVAVIWAITFLVMVPSHNRLSAGFDPAAHRSLVRWNWWRTLAWSCRAILVF